MMHDRPVADQQATDPLLIELERRQARRELDRAIANLLAVYTRSARTRGDALAAIDQANGLMHNDVRWFTWSRTVQLAEATYPDYLPTRLVLLPGARGDDEGA